MFFFFCDRILLKSLDNFISQESPETPKGENPDEMVSENHQLWSLSGESCPEGTIPIRRTTEQDVLRASSIQRFGRKIRRPIRRDSSSNGHEVSYKLLKNMFSKTGEKKKKTHNSFSGGRPEVRFLG